MMKRTNTHTNKKYPTTVKGIGQRKHEQKKKWEPKVSIVGKPFEQLLGTIRADLGQADKSYCIFGRIDQERTDEDMARNVVRYALYEFTCDWMDSMVDSAKAKFWAYLEDIRQASIVNPELHCDVWYIGQTHNPHKRFIDHRSKWQATALVCIGKTNCVYAANAIERKLILKGDEISKTQHGPAYGKYRNRQKFKKLIVDKKRANDVSDVYFYIAFKGLKIAEFLIGKGVPDVYC